MLDIDALIMSIRQQQHSTPNIIPRTEFVLNFNDNPRNVYVDENDLGVSHAVFPEKYTSAVQNPWFCYDEALQRIRQEAARGNGLSLGEIKLFTNNRPMQLSQNNFSNHRATTWDRHSFLGSNKFNYMKFTDTLPDLSGENIVNIKHFSHIPNIRPIRGEKKGFTDAQEIKAEIDHFRYIFQHAEILPGHYSNMYTPNILHGQKELKPKTHKGLMGELKLGIHGDLFSNTVSEDQDWEYKTDLQSEDSNNHHLPQFFRL
jgi:hypothetical protein